MIHARFVGQKKTILYAYRSSNCPRTSKISSTVPQIIRCEITVFTTASDCVRLKKGTVVYQQVMNMWKAVLRYDG